jgi:hypothetical protein
MFQWKLLSSRCSFGLMARPSKKRGYMYLEVVKLKLEAGVDAG